MHTARRTLDRMLLMPKKWFIRHRKPILWSVYGTIFAILLVQIFYPNNRTLPLTQIGGKSAGFQDKASVTDKLTALASNAQATIKIDQYLKQEKITAMGAVFDKEKTVETATSYPLWQRLIPLSLFYAHSGEMTLSYSFDDNVLKAYAEKIAGEVHKDPRNATLSIKDSKVVNNDAEAGAQLETAVFMQKVKKATYRGEAGTLFLLTRSAVKPNRDAGAIKEVRQQAEDALNKSITIKALDKEYKPDKSERAKWITFKEGEHDGYSVEINKEAIEAYLNTIASAIYVAPGVTQVAIVDGKETSRTKGSDGRGLDVAAVETSLQAALFKGEKTTIEAKVSTIAAKVQVAGKYTNSQQGLQAYLDNLATTKSMNIVVRHISGSGWSASAKGADKVVAASTYKLFVSFALFEQIKANVFSWNGSMLDTTISGCFERMIVNSDNACAEKFISMIGRSKIDSILQTHGFSSATKFVTSDWALMSSANDLMKLLTGLNDGSLISGDDRTRLLGLMNRQVYRQGVPAGSSGSVADKVGFLNEILNDAAIVTTPNGTYAISIMTRNSSWAEIAQITRTIESLMYL